MTFLSTEIAPAPRSRPTVSISAAPYDGHPVPEMLESLARCGATHVEPAYIVNYTEPFDETAFSERNAALWRNGMNEHGIACEAFSAHIDLGNPGAADVFCKRMDFARSLGARIINTNAAISANAEGFARNLPALLRHAEAIGIVLGFENPGDGRANLIDTAADGIALIQRIDSPWARLNYDAGNTVSHRPGVDPVADALLALPACGHTHIKDVKATAAGWHFVPPGTGDIDCAAIIGAVVSTSHIDLSIELPLRMQRGPDAQPQRAPYPVTLVDIEAGVRQSLAFVNGAITAALLHHDPLQTQSPNTPQTQTQQTPLPARL
jgi:sugar phosphate isomerase/epimerase